MSETAANNEYRDQLMSEIADLETAQGFAQHVWDVLKRTSPDNSSEK